MGAIHTRASPQHDLGDVKDMLNRVIDSLSGSAGAGQRIRLTDYDGVLKDPYGGANLSSSDFSQVIRNTAAGGQHEAILLSATSPTATPSASNSVWIVQDGAVAVCAGKNLNLFNTAGSNDVTLVHSGTDNHLKTLGGFWALGALNVGSALTATTAGDALVQHALNVGDTVTASGPGDGYLAGGVRVGTGTTALATANGRVTVGENVVLGVTGGQFRGVIAGSASDKVLVIGTATDTTPGDEHFAVQADGQMQWGPGGAAARDVTLARVSTTTMEMTGSLKVTNSVVSVGAFNYTGSSAVNGVVALQKTSTAKGYVGLDATDQFSLLNATPAVIAFNPASTLHWLSTVPTARMTASGTTVSSAGSGVALQMDATTFDTDSMADTTNKRLKATRAGKYRISGCAEYPGNAGGGLRWTRIQLNATTDIANMTDTAPAGTFGLSAIQHNLTTLYTLAVNDFLTMFCYQDSGGSRTVTGHMAMEFVSI